MTGLNIDRGLTGPAQGAGFSVSGGLSYVPTVANPYHANAVDFTSSTFMECASLTSTDSNVWAASGWIRAAADAIATAPVLWSGDTAVNETPFCFLFRVGHPGSSQFGAEFNDIPVTGDTQFSSGASLYNNDTWFHYLLAVQLNSAAPRTIKLYINDIDVTTRGSDTGVATSIIIPTNGKSFRLCGDGSAADAFTGALADTRLMPNTLLLSGGDIPVATRRLFISAAGKPVDPAIATAALGAPCMLFSGNAANFGTNQGTGGTFTTTGTALTNSATSPSD